MELPRLLFKGNFSPEDILITIGNPSNRKVSQQIENKADRIWKEILLDMKERGAKVWDSCTYRLNAFRHEGNRLSLELSEISYKERRVLRACCDEVIQMGEDYFGKGLSIATFIKTRDSKYIFGVLSNSTLNSKTIKVNLISGAMSKDEIEIDGPESIFDFVFAELKEEIGVDKSYIKDCNLIGGILAQTTQISFYFLTNLSLTADEVIDIHSNSNDGEVSRLEIIEPQNLFSYLNENFSRLQPAIADISSSLIY